jgi:hypothetical protein
VTDGTKDILKALDPSNATVLGRAILRCQPAPSLNRHGENILIRNNCTTTALVMVHLEINEPHAPLFPNIPSCQSFF